MKNTDYITTKEAAGKWGINARIVQTYCKDGRVAGAKKLGASWMIPADSEKPQDLRKAGKSDLQQRPQYSVLPVLHIHGGDLDGAFERCLSDEERTLLEANLSFWRGEAGAVGKLAGKLYKSTAEPQIKLGSGIMLALSAMCLGDASTWKTIMSEMSDLRVPEELQMEKEFAIAAVNAGLHGKGVYPKWLDRGAFAGITPELFPGARWVYVSILYTQWKEVELLTVAEPMIAECRRERSDLCEIYLRIYAAAAYFDHRNEDMAREHLDEAISLAQPLGFIEPFIEYRRTLMGFMDARLKVKYPGALSTVKKRMQPFFDCWTKVYNAVWDEPIAAELTPREFEACGLAARGMMVEEIAWRMGISKSSVKKYLNAAYSKLSVDEKKKLSLLVRP